MRDWAGPHWRQVRDVLHSWRRAAQVRFDVYGKPYALRQASAPIVDELH